MEFADPPASGRDERSQEWRDKVKAMKERPNVWANVGTYSPGVATQIRRGKYRAFREGFEGDPGQLELYMQRHWEVRTSKTGDRSRQAIYIRWIG